MDSNRISFEDLADYRDIIEGFGKLEKATEKWGNATTAQNERIRQSLSGMIIDLNKAKDSILTMTNAQFKQSSNGGLKDYVTQTTQAYKQQESALERNKQLIDLNTASVDALRKRIADLKEEYNSLDRSEKQNLDRMKQIETETKQTAQVLNTLTAATNRATKAVQVAERSYDALSKETAEMKARLKSMSDAFDVNTGKVNKNNKAAVDLQRQIEKNDKALKSFDATMGNHQRNVGNYGSALGGIGSSALGAATALLGVSSALDAIQAGFHIMAEFERIDAMLMAVSKDSADFNRTQQMLLGTADRLGISYAVLAETYKGLKAASRGTALEGQATERIFQAIINRGAQLKLSSEQVEGALKAVEQMMSKGKVSAEELRGQLGERLPGAFKLFADALGVSEIKLNKMLEQGEVLASVALPKVAEQMEKTYGKANADAIDTITASTTRLKDQTGLLIAEFGKTSGIGGFFSKITNGLADTMRAIRELVKSGEWGELFSAFNPFTNSIGDMMSGAGLKNQKEKQRTIDNFRTQSPEQRTTTIDNLKSKIAEQQAAIAGGADNAEIRAQLKRNEEMLTELRRENLKLSVKDREDAKQNEINAQRAEAQQQEIQADKKKKDDQEAKRKKEEAQRKADQQLQKQLSLSKTDTGVQLSKLSNDKQDGLISEEEYNKKRYDITMAGIAARQKLLADAGKKETDDYKELASEKLDAETQYHRDSLKQALAAVKLDTDTQLKELELRKEEGKVSEQTYINERYRIALFGGEKRLEVLRKAGLEESELAKQISNEITDADRQRARDQRKLDEKTWKEAVELTKSSLQEINQAQKTALDELLADLNDWYEQQKQVIELQGAKGQISDGEVDQKLYELRKEYLQRFVDAQIDSIHTAEKLEQERIDQLLALADTEEEREILKQLRLKVARESQIDVDKAIAKNRIEQSDSATKKEIEDAHKIKEARQAMLDNYKQAAETAVSAVFENQQQASENYLSMLDKQKETELQAVGDNADAKKAIEDRYEKQVREIKRRQAIADKLQAAFSIGINTAVAISKTLAEGGPLAIPLSISIGALGAVQLAAVLSKPLPAYKDGKNVSDSYSGPALVGEAGRELWLHDGKAELVDKPSIVNVGRKDIIYPNSVTERLLTDERAFEANELLHRNYKQARAVESIQQNKRQDQIAMMTKAATSSGTSAQDMAKALGREIAKLPLQQTIFDDQGVREYVIEGTTRRTKQKDKHRLR